MTSFDLEPFMEPADHTKGRMSGRAYRFGYRIPGSAEVVSAVEVPASIVEHTIMQGAFLSVRSSPDGTITSQISISYSANAGSTREATPIDELVRNAVDLENLRMEEATSKDLNTLLERLERSISVVKDAIDQVADASKAIS